MDKRLAGASLLVFVNKTDIKGCMEEDEVREALELDRLVTHRWTIIQCSAITGKNLDQGLSWVVQDARDRLFLY
jgi:ADP-ribosylation factor-like protein 2